MSRLQCLSVRCVKLESGRLAEEVKDCGPVVDLEATPGCFLVKDGADPKADFPACCPVYECEEGTEVTHSLINSSSSLISIPLESFPLGFQSVNVIF